MDGVIWVEVNMSICFDVDTELGREMIALANAHQRKLPVFLTNAVFERIKGELPELIDSFVVTPRYATDEDDEDIDMPF